MMIIMTLSMCILTLANFFYFLRLHRAPSSFSIDRYKKLQCLFFAFQLRLSILSGSRFIWLVWILLCESVWRVALFFSRASRFSLVYVCAPRTHHVLLRRSVTFIYCFNWVTVRFYLFYFSSIRKVLKQWNFVVVVCICSSRCSIEPAKKISPSLNRSHDLDSLAKPVYPFRSQFSVGCWV